MTENDKLLIQTHRGDYPRGEFLPGLVRSMRKLLSGALALVLLAALGGYMLWAEQRPEGHYLSDLRVEVALDQGVPSGQGNLLGIEPLLYPGDYQNLTRLHRKLAAYLEQARVKGLVNERTVVVLPEHIGTWLWARGEKRELYQVTRLREAYQWLELSNPLRYGLAMASAEGDDRRADAHLRMKAGQMAADYQKLFGDLAREFGVTLVAGSIVLPEPYLDHGVLRTGSGALYNSSLVFAGNGAVLGEVQRQQYPDSNVRRFISAGTAHPPQVIDTPAGRLGVLLGSDAWYPSSYARLASQDAQIIANPAFVSDWHGPWRGNRHQAQAADLLLQPAETSEEQAWYRLSESTVPAGVASMSVFLRGQFWEVRGEGLGFANLNGLFHASSGRGARLLNLWL